MLELAVLLMGLVGVIGIAIGATSSERNAETIAKKAGRAAPTDADRKAAKQAATTALVMGIVMIGITAYVELTILHP